MLAVARRVVLVDTALVALCTTSGTRLVRCRRTRYYFIRRKMLKSAEEGGDAEEVSGGIVKVELRFADAERSKTLDFGSQLEIAQIQILSVTLALFISTIDGVLYRLSPLFCLLRSSQRPVAHEAF
ncbi:hypothetical protein J6590_025053 [Homalodisca vitripennis]|nr:hypothetical protein J6590_025053 [Homalodisca vitripennis]